MAPPNGARLEKIDSRLRYVRLKRSAALESKVMNLTEIAKNTHRQFPCCDLRESLRLAPRDHSDVDIVGNFGKGL